MKKKKLVRHIKLRTKEKHIKRNRYITKELVIYVFNVVEDEWSFVSSIQPLEKRFENINELNNGADCYLFSNAAHDEFIYISPIKIDNSFSSAHFAYW